MIVTTFLTPKKKRTIKEIAGSCLVCGSFANLEVHHVDSNRFNNNPSNWIVLCKSCHLREHGISRSATLIRLAKMKQQIVAWCPECGVAMVKAGRQRANRKGDRKQMYVCTYCGRRTVNPREEDK